MFGTLLNLFESTQRKLGHEKMGLFGFARIPGHREVIVRFRLIFEQGSGGRRSSSYDEVVFGETTRRDIVEAEKKTES
jgi:hypothetical protein